MWEKLLKLDGVSVKDVKNVLKILRIEEHSDEFMHEISNKVEKYLEQLGNDEITIDEFNSYMKDIIDLIKAETLGENIIRNAILQKTVDILSKLLIDGAVATLKKLV